MKQRLTNILSSPVFQSCVLAFALVVYFYGDILFHPGSYLFSVSPDGIKGYYTYAWQIRYGETPFEFTGMNYPHGEHMLFTDGHTLFVLLSWCFPFLSSYPVETINLCMLLSIVVTAGVMSALLREWGARHVFAVVGALMITFFSPQLMRMTGHFSLSYAFVIPLGLLWWTRWMKTEKHFTYAWRMALLVLVMLFVHIYPAIMLVMLIGVSSLVYAWYQPSIRKKMRYWSAVALGTVVPVILFRVLMMMTDTHENRSENPTGFFEYHSAWKGIFLPVTGYFSPWLNRVINVEEVAWEKWAYLGTATILAIIIGVCIRFMPSPTEEKKPFTFLMLLIPALVLLIFSAGFPFRFFPKLADVVAFIKQFRVLARFSWPFYIVAGMYAVLVVQYVFSQQRFKKIIRYGLPALLIIITTLDVWHYNHMVRSWAGNNPNVFDINQLSPDYTKAAEIIKNEKPEFLITLPFFHVGSEMYNRAGSGKSRQIAFTLSYHSGKPLLNVEMGRTSLNETENTLNLFVPHYAQKPADENFLRGKVIIIDTHNETNWRDKELLTDCKQIFTCAEFTVYQGKAEEIFAARKSEMKMDSFYRKSPGVAVSDSLGFYRSNEFDKLHNGVLKRYMPEYTMLDTFVPGGLMADSTYEISFHFRTENKSRKGGMFIVETIDETGKSEWVEVADLARGGMTYKENIIFEYRFKAREKTKRHNLFIVDGGHTNDFYLLDHYLLRTPQQNVYVTGTDTLLNNYPVLNK